MGGTIILVLVILVLLSKAIYVLREYERGVVFRLGRLTGVRGPGFVLIIPFIDRLVRVQLRIVAMDVPPQDVITKDNVSVKVNAVVYFRVFEPDKAIVEVEDYNYATSQLSQTTLRSVIGAAELDELLSEREKINQELQSILDKATDSWGIKVSAVEVKHVDLPESMQTMTADERAAYVQEMSRTRAGIKQQIESLSRQRQAFIAAEMERQALDASKGLDDAIRRAVREQARRKGLSFPQDTAPRSAASETE